MHSYPIVLAWSYTEAQAAAFYVSSAESASKPQYESHPNVFWYAVHLSLLLANGL